MKLIRLSGNEKMLIVFLIAFIIGVVAEAMVWSSLFFMGI
jgi:cell division protein FtsL